MNNSKLYIASVITCTFFNIYAQDVEETDDDAEKVNINSNRKFKNEVGLDISPFKFILGNYSAAYPSLFYRRHFTKNKSVKSLPGIFITSYQAYRVRIGSNLAFENTETPDIKTIQNNYFSYGNFDRSLSGNSSFFIRLGKEKQIRSKRFELFYGYDLFFNYNYFYNYYVSSSLISSAPPIYDFVNQEWNAKNSTVSFGLAPIGGLKYFLLPRLSFSAEATINLSYFQQEKINEYNFFNTSTKEFKQESYKLTSSGMRIDINPIFVVNLGYYF